MDWLITYAGNSGSRISSLVEQLAHDWPTDIPDPDAQAVHGDRDRWLLLSRNPAESARTLPVRAEDTVDFRGELGVVAVATPNPSVFNESITYTVTVTNLLESFPVKNLIATYQMSPVLASIAPENGLLLTGNALSRALQATSGTLTLNPTALGPLQTATATLTTTEQHTGTYLFIVTVVGETFVPNDTTGSTSISITPQGTSDLDPNATEPILEKKANVSTTQPGGKIVWTITVRNGGTSTFPNVVVQEDMPAVLTINSVQASQGTSVTQGQVVTVNTGIMEPGSTVTITINTTVSADAPVPSSIVNSVCTTREGGGQACKTTTVNIGPGVDTLPTTGIGSVGSGADSGDAVPRFKFWSIGGWLW